MDLLLPRRAPDALIRQDLARLKDVPLLEDVSSLPASVLAKKRFCLRLANGQIGWAVDSSEEGSDSRRNFLKRVRSHVRQSARWGRGVERIPVNVYGAVHLYAVVCIGGAVKAYT